MTSTMNGAVHPSSEEGKFKCPALLLEQAGESEMSRRLYRVLLKWIRYADKQYVEWPERPYCGHFFGGAYWYGIETGYTALVYAAAGKLGEYDEALTGLPRESVVAKAISAIRYLCFTHDSGPEEYVRVQSRNPFCSGKKWGGKGDDFFRASQTGTVVHAIGCAAWLLQDELDDETKQLVENVLAYYADWWSGEAPRNGVYFDTQCEENGWTAAGIGAAAALLPEHPRSGKWREAANRWAINAVSTPKDRITRREAVSTVTFHPDFTAENHAFVHPSYMMAGIYLRAYDALLLVMSGKPVPEALTLNNAAMYERTVNPWSTIDGIPYPVQGQDWWYNRQHEALMTHAIVNVLHGNADAALLERAALEFVEKLQDSNTRGCLLEENGEECIVQAASYQTAMDMEFGSAHNLMIAYLFHRFGGAGADPTPTRQWREATAGVYEYPYGCAIVHRTERAFSSFSWRSNVMAVTLPEAGMWSITPLYTSYTGEVEFEGEAPEVSFNESKSIDTAWQRIRRQEAGFGAAAEIARGRGGKLRQYIGFISLPDGRSLYAERIRVTEACHIKRLSTGMIGVRNERYQQLADYASGSITLTTGDGAKRYEGFYGKEPNRLEAIPPVNEVNINNEIGYVVFHSAGMTYLNQHEYPKWRGVEDVLTLNVRSDLRLDGPAELPVFAVLTVPNATAEETKAQAEQTQLLSESTADYAIVETDGYLMTVNFGRKRSGLRVSHMHSSSRVQLFEGTVLIHGNGIIRELELEEGAGYIQSRYALEWNEGVEEGEAIEGLEATVAGSRLFLKNSCGRPASCRVDDRTTGARIELRLEPGELRTVGVESEAGTGR